MLQTSNVPRINSDSRMSSRKYETPGVDEVRQSVCREEGPRRAVNSACDGLGASFAALLERVQNLTVRNVGQRQSATSDKFGLTVLTSIP